MRDTSVISKICRGINAESLGKTCVPCECFPARPSSHDITLVHFITPV